MKKLIVLVAVILTLALAASTLYAQATVTVFHGAGNATDSADNEVFFVISAIKKADTGPAQSLTTHGHVKLGDLSLVVISGFVEGCDEGTFNLIDRSGGGDMYHMVIDLGNPAVDDDGSITLTDPMSVNTIYVLNPAEASLRCRTNN